MPIWKDCQLTLEKAKELKLDELHEPKTKDYVFILVASHFGGVCSKRQLKRIANMVYKAYKKKEAKQNGTKKKIDKGTNGTDSK